MSDDDLRQWVYNDEHLFHWFLNQEKEIWTFVADNREEIEKVIKDRIARAKKEKEGRVMRFSEWIRLKDDAREAKEAISLARTSLLDKGEEYDAVWDYVSKASLFLHTLHIALESGDCDNPLSWEEESDGKDSVL